MVLNQKSQVILGVELPEAVLTVAGSFVPLTKMRVKMIIYTTGEAARMCNVKPGIVSKWYETAGLEGSRAQGSLKPDIPMKNLVKFLHEKHFPFSDELKELLKMQILVISANSEFVSSVSKAVESLACEKISGTFRTASTDFQANTHLDEMTQYADASISVGGMSESNKKGIVLTDVRIGQNWVKHFLKKWSMHYQIGFDSENQISAKEAFDEYLTQLDEIPEMVTRFPSLA